MEKDKLPVYPEESTQSMEKENSDVFSVRNLIAGCCFFAVYMLIYGHLILRLGFNPDEILDFKGENNAWYVACGRWGGALYRLVVHGGAVPYAAGVVAGLYLTLAYLFQISLFKLKTPLCLLLYGAVCVGLSQFAYMQQYSHQSDCIALGSLLISISAYILVERWRERWMLVCAVLLLTLALGMYQVLALQYVVLCMTAYLIRGEEPQAVMGRGISYITRTLVTALLAVLLYFACDWGLKHTDFVPPYYLEKAAAYQRSMYAPWLRFMELPLESQLRFFARIGKDIVISCMGVRYPGEWVYATCVIPVAMLLWRYWRFCVRVSDAVWKSIIVLCIWIAPHSYLVIFTVPVGARLCLAESMSCACLWVLAIRMVALSPWYKRCLVAFSFIVIIKACYLVSGISWQERITHDNFTATLRGIYCSAEMRAKDAGLREGEYDVVLVDAYTWLNDRSEKSLGVWPWAAHWFSRYLELPQLRTVLEGELTPEIVEILKQRRSWPATNCCYLTPNRVYVRVSARSVDGQLCFPFVSTYDDPMMKKQD